jgi:hypothetical protein
MKIFRYPHGNIAKQTMTVKELREALEEFPDNMPIFAEWETVCGPLDSRFFTIQPIGYGFADDNEDCLIMDVN